MIVTWLLLVLVTGRLSSIFQDHYQIMSVSTIAALMSSFVPLSSGSIIFPFSMLVMGYSPSEARGLAMAIEAVGMACEAFFAIVLRLPISWATVLFGGLGGVVGLVAGMYASKKLDSTESIDMLSVSVFCCLFNLWLIERLRGSIVYARAALPSRKPNVVRALLVVTGFIGGAIYGICGEGIGSSIFILLTLCFFLHTSVALPSAILVMCTVSLSGACISAALGDFDNPRVYADWLAAVPFSVIGASFGLCGSLHIRRGIIIVFGMVLSFAQLVAISFARYRDPMHLGFMGALITFWNVATNMMCSIGRSLFPIFLYNDFGCQFKSNGVLPPEGDVSVHGLQSYRSADSIDDREHSVRHSARSVADLHYQQMRPSALARALQPSSSGAHVNISGALYRSSWANDNPTSDARPSRDPTNPAGANRSMPDPPGDQRKLETAMCNDHHVPSHTSSVSLPSTVGGSEVSQPSENPDDFLVSPASSFVDLASLLRMSADCSNPNLVSLHDNEFHHERPNFDRLTGRRASKHALSTPSPPSARRKVTLPLPPPPALPEPEPPASRHSVENERYEKGSLSPASLPGSPANHRVSSALNCVGFFHSQLSANTMEGNCAPVRQILDIFPTTIQGKMYEDFLRQIKLEYKRHPFTLKLKDEEGSNMYNAESFTPKSVVYHCLASVVFCLFMGSNRYHVGKQLESALCMTAMVFVLLIGTAFVNMKVDKAVRMQSTCLFGQYVSLCVISGILPVFDSSDPRISLVSLVSSVILNFVSGLMSVVYTSMMWTAMLWGQVVFMSVIIFRVLLLNKIERLYVGGILIASVVTGASLCFASYSVHQFRMDFFGVRISLLKQLKNFEQLIERTNFLLEHMLDPLLLLNTEGKIVLANPAAHELFECASGALHEQDFDNLIVNVDGTKGPATRSTGGAGAYRFIKQLNGQAAIPVRIKVNKVCMNDSWYHIVNLEDLREHIKHENELQAALLEQEKANREMIQATKAKTDLLSFIAHELRNPLHAVVGVTEELAEDASLNREQKEHTQTILSLSEIMSVIVNDVLDLAKIEAGKIELEVIPFDPILLVKGIVNANHHKAKAKGIYIKFEAPESGDIPQIVHGDPTRVQQVVLNFVSNALKFTVTGGVIVSLSLAAKSPSSETSTASVITQEKLQQQVVEQPDVFTGSSAALSINGESLYTRNGLDSQVVLRLSIADTGVGIHPEALQHIFDAYTQEHVSTAREHGGTGLGLSIVKNIVTLMKGTVSVQSELGVGSRFEVILPFVDPVWVKRKHCQGATSSPAAVATKTPADCVAQSSMVSKKEQNISIADEDDEVLSLVPGFRSPLPEKRARLTLAAGYPKRPKHVELSSESYETKLDDPHDSPVQKRNGRIQPDSDGPDDISAVSEATPVICAHHLSDGGNDDTGTRADDKVTAGVSNSEAGDAHKLRVLVAEDVVINQKLMLRFLASFRVDVEVVVANHGLEAVSYVDQHGPDYFHICFMDVNMPVMDGIKATQQLRARGYRAPIYAMTANALTEDKRKHIEAGFDQHLTKPFKKKDVHKILETTIKNMTSLQEVPLASSDAQVKADETEITGKKKPKSTGSKKMKRKDQVGTGTSP